MNINFIAAFGSFLFFALVFIAYCKWDDHNHEIAE